MKCHLPRLLAAVAALWLALPAAAQQGDPPDEVKATAGDDAPEAAGEADADDAYATRLPNNWNRIGLSEKQVEIIYALQKELRPQLDRLELEIDELRQQLRDRIDALEKQLAQREATLDRQMWDVLTDEQVEALDRIELEALRKRQEQRRQAIRRKAG